ncbi:MAG: hypothetical protein WHT06_16265 [Desulfobacterales bacterium]
MSGKPGKKRSTFGGGMRSVLLAAAAFALSACAALQERPEPFPGPPLTDPAVLREAEAVLAAIRKTNETLVTCKGIGRLTVRREGRVQMDDRIAWIGSEPRRLSLVLFASGFPALRLAGDGETFYFQEATAPGAPVRKIRSGDPDFSRVLALPLAASDILALLRGRTPLRAERVERFHPIGTGPGHLLLLSAADGSRQALFLDEERTEVRETQFYDASGRLVLLVQFLEMQKVDGYRVPLRVRVADDRENALVLVVERYWAGVPVTPSMFVLEPAG